MIIDTLNSPDYHEISFTDLATLRRINPYYSFVSDDEIGNDRVPVPAAILEENSDGAQARDFMKAWLLANPEHEIRKNASAGWFCRWGKQKASRRGRLTSRILASNTITVDENYCVGGSDKPYTVPFVEGMTVLREALLQADWDLQALADPEVLELGREVQNTLCFDITLDGCRSSEISITAVQ